MDRKFRLKRIALLLTALLILLSAAAPAASAAASDKTETLRMGFFEFGGMFGGAEDGAEKSGYCYEYMMQVAVYTGWKYEFVYGSYGELYEKLKNGEIDILPYTNFNEQRDTEVLFSDKALAVEEYYIAVKDEGFSSVESLRGRVISTVEGADYNGLLLNYIRDARLEMSVRYYRNLDETWAAVDSGEADATVLTSNAYSNDGWRSMSCFGKKPTYIAVARNRPDILLKLNEATEMIDIDKPAFLGELYSNYFSDNPMRRSISQEEQQWLLEHPVLHVGGFVNDAPYLLTVDNETGEATGLTVDMVNGIIERLSLGITADYRGYGSLGEMYAALDSGEIDVIMPFYPDSNIAAQNNLINSNVVRVSNMELVYKSGTPYREALERVATPSAKLGAFYVRSTFPDSEIIGVQSIQDAVNKVLSGEASGAIAQNVVMHNIMERYDGLDYTVLSEGCGTCFAARPEHYPLIRLINRGLNYYTDAEISSIASLYNPEPNVTTKAFLASHSEIVVLLVMIFVILAVLAVALIQVNRLKMKADEASRSKTNFLFNMSHDIRTPMNAITGFTKMAKKSLGDEEKVSEYLDKIDISGQQLLTLVNQILEMARIESGRVELEEKSVDIRREYSHTVTVLSEQAAVNGQLFSSSIENVVHSHILADSARMDSVILNIIGNAMKYTPRGGVINFCVREVPAERDGFAGFVFTVEDTGIGMSEEYQKVLFEPFTREKNSTVSRIQGAGLGMSIVKNLVDLMGGEIHVKSAPGEGTRFDVRIDFRIDAEGGKENQAEQPENRSSFSGRRVLLVEDNEMNREIAEDILGEEGLTVEEADDGTAAVRMFREKGPDYYDFILMDIQMPVMGGYEATKLIREMYPDAHVPIIALSANAFAEDRAASLAAGMDDHVAKPIDIDTLFSALAKFL